MLLTSLLLLFPLMLMMVSVEVKLLLVHLVKNGRDVQMKAVAIIGAMAMEKRFGLVFMVRIAGIIVYNSLRV